MPTPPDRSEQEATRPGAQPGFASPPPDDAVPQGELGYTGPLPPMLEPPGTEPEDDSEERTEVDPAQPIADVPLDDPSNPLRLNFKINIPLNEGEGEGE